MSLQPTTNFSESSTGEAASLAPGGGSPLDALLSPHPNATFVAEEAVPLPESDEESDGKEVVLDDSHFSTVPLSARQSKASIASNASVISTATQVGRESGRKATVSLTASDSSTMALHRRSLSASSDRSESVNGNTPFILARLESQKEQEELGSKGHRVSVDGQQKLQEEFVRMQQDIKEEEEESAATAAAIDWGM